MSKENKRVMDVHHSIIDYNEAINASTKSVPSVPSS